MYKNQNGQYMKLCKYSLIMVQVTTSIIIHGYNLLDVTQYGYEQYQHIVINGKIVDNMPPTNKQQPEKRYAIIKKFLDQYQRPFTMLDLGAAQGYHSLKAAWHYPQSVFVMIEGNNHAYKLAGDQLLSICKCNDKLHNIIHLNKSLIIDDLVRLGECEHFDVVLALNVIHWQGNWKKAIDAITQLGDNIIIETPPAAESDQKREIVEYLQKRGATLIAQVPRHAMNNLKNAPMFLIQATGPKKLRNASWLQPKGNYEIISDFKAKKLKKLDNGKEIITPWIPGINLMTFNKYQGAYPLAETVKDKITQLKKEVSANLVPNNIIVQGNKLTHKPK